MSLLTCSDIAGLMSQVTAVTLLLDLSCHFVSVLASFYALKKTRRSMVQTAKLWRGVIPLLAAAGKFDSFIYFIFAHKHSKTRLISKENEQGDRDCINSRSC